MSTHVRSSVIHTDHLKLGLGARKPVFWVYDQVKLKPTCPAKEAS